MKTSLVNLNTGKFLLSVFGCGKERVGACGHSRLVVSSRVNPLSLVEIILHVVRQMTGESGGAGPGGSYRQFWSCVFIISMF